MWETGVRWGLCADGREASKEPVCLLQIEEVQLRKQ
jgi:hypothetical protein